MEFKIKEVLQKWSIISYDDMIENIFKKERYSCDYTWDYKDLETWEIYNISDKREFFYVDLDMLLDGKQVDFVYWAWIIIVLDYETEDSYSLLPTREWLECVYLNAY